MVVAVVVCLAETVAATAQEKVCEAETEVAKVRAEVRLVREWEVAAAAATKADPLAGAVLAKVVLPAASWEMGRAVEVAEAETVVAAAGTAAEVAAAPEKAAATVVATGWAAATARVGQVQAAEAGRVECMAGA